MLPIRITLLTGLLAALSPVTGRSSSRVSLPRSPFDVAFSPGGSLLAVSDATARCCYLVDVDDARVRTTIQLEGAAKGCAWVDERTMLVAEYGAGSVAVIDAMPGTVRNRIETGPKPFDVAPLPEKSAVLVSDYGLGEIIEIDLATRGVVRRIAVDRFPCFVSVGPDAGRAVVAHHLPTGPATSPDAAATVTIIDLETWTTQRVELPDGSTNVREVAVSPDGKWAYVVHTRGRPGLVTSQLDRGWVNTNALSIIDLRKSQYHTGLLLDSPDRGAADPWGVALSPGGSRLFASIAGTHELAAVNLPAVHSLLAGTALLDTAKLGSAHPYSGTAFRIWSEVARESTARHALINHLNALSATPHLRRTQLPVRGPRGVAVSPDGQTVAVGGYYSGAIVLCSAKDNTVVGTISLDPRPTAAPARTGEDLYHDATLCFQSWLSCATCHPEGRADGLNWDLLNDGMGNPKNVKSHLLADRTPPAMAHGVRASYDVAVKAGFKHIMFAEVRPDTIEAVKTYIRSLQPEPSPYLRRSRWGGYRLTRPAKRGRKVFESQETGCSACHPAPLFTDLQSHDVGTRDTLDTLQGYDTPSLIELWRTPPYLHDGRAATVRQLLTRHNEADRLGKTSHLTEEEIDALAKYLLSL